MDYKLLLRFDWLKVRNFWSVGRFFIYCFVAFLPFQIKTLIFTGSIYDSGFFNPYLSHFLYLNDICLILALLFFGIALVFGNGNYKNKFAEGDLRLTVLIGIFLVFYVFSSLVSADKMNSLFYTLRFFEFFVVYLLLSHNFVSVKKFIYVFMGSMTVVSFIGILQYVFQQSIGLKFLGEPVVSSSTLGVAKLDLMNSSILRSYGTFPHPNIFAVYLLFAIFFSIYYWKNFKQLFTMILIVLGAALILTFSRGAMLAFLAGIIVYYFVSKIKISWKYLVLVVVLLVAFILFFNLSPVLSGRFLIGDSNSLAERSQLYSISGRMFIDNWAGVGAGNFTEVMQNYIPDKLTPWQFQPVHNIFMLLLNEIGIFGVTIFVAIFAYIMFCLLRISKGETVDKKPVSVLMALWIVIFVVGLFDHYFISLYQGQALLWIFFGLTGVAICSFKKSPF